VLGGNTGREKSQEEGIWGRRGMLSWGIQVSKRKTVVESGALQERWKSRKDVEGIKILGGACFE